MLLVLNLQEIVIHKNYLDFICLLHRKSVCTYHGNLTFFNNTRHICEPLILME